LTEINSH